MGPELEQIRNQQKDSWNKFSPGWKKWDEITMKFLKSTGAEIIRLLNPQKDDIVLDIASGTGEPGLTIASMLEGGKVVLTDLSEGMLQVATQNAERRGIKNIETHVCDVCELPFSDNTFDSISCRFGFMFFPDMILAAKEMVRVLKPGGKLATSVWNIPEKNFWITAVMGNIAKNMDLPTPPPGAPGMFRCAKDGLISGLLSQVGLTNVSQTEIAAKLECSTAEVYWEMMTEVGAPIVAALSKADEATRKKINREVVELVNLKCPEGNIILDTSALVIYGEK